MKLTNIKKLTANKYELIIDDKKHVIFDDVLLNFNILTKKDICEEEYKNIIDLNSFYEGYYEAIKYISYKLRTEKEIKDKLYIKKYNSEIIKKIIKKLRDDNYLNDDRYIKSFINDEISLTLNGPDKISSLLMKQGFKKNIIDIYIDKVPYDIWLNKVQKVIDKKIKSNHEYSQKNLKLKIKRDLYALGYKNDYENIINAIIFDEQAIYNKIYQKYYKKYSQKYSGETLDRAVKKKMIELGFEVSNYY